MNKFWSIATKIGTIFGVIGISANNLLDDKEKSLAAFIIVILAALYCCWQMQRLFALALRRRYKSGFLPIASSTRFSTSDGKHYTYEQFRHIQVKKPYMRFFEHKFVWTGTNVPVVSSDLQRVKQPEVMEMEHGSHGHCVKLEFLSTRIYNDAEVVHINMAVDDSDQRASPHISQKVEEPVRLLSWRIELLHATQSYYKNKAELTRKPIDKPGANKESIKSINFDVASKSYSANLPNPEPGYAYTLSWERPPLPRNGRGKK
ncbi:hypothetical protein [Castellaniella sp.]|uniref:hypothetical protein n=1 Tax=Castellaniella sp. TaxID=1955812 RepID=UPI002AFEBFB6|nr:hypothetical protein [Castellaniella sp.]